MENELKESLRNAQIALENAVEVCEKAALEIERLRLKNEDPMKQFEKLIATIFGEKK